MDGASRVTPVAFGPDEMLACYARGVFPMSESREDPTVRLVDPEIRGVIPLDGLRVSRRLARRVRSGAFEVRIDTAFMQMVEACARPGPGREETWISFGVEALYGELYLRGHAHSVECWTGDRLAGGLYGVSLGGAFFGESMVSHAPDASKVALVHLAARLTRGGYTLLDTQFLTAHLSTLGAVEVPRREYRRRLEAALLVEADFYRLEPYADGAAVLQAINHRS